MSHGATGLNGKTAGNHQGGGRLGGSSGAMRAGGFSRVDNSSPMEPIIRRGTQARVHAVDKAIRAFLSLPLTSESTDTTNGTEDAFRASRQVVVLGAGRDTSYLRYRFGQMKRDASDISSESTTATTTTTSAATNVEEDVRWYEVDHPSVIQQKAKHWLPGCISAGNEYNCTSVTTESSIEGETSKASNSYVVSISQKEEYDTQSTSDRSSNYHLIGHDLREPPSKLFDILALPQHGYDRTVPTLFILECVTMYLPDDASRELMQYLSDSVQPSTSDSFVALVSYDPIPGNDRFGEVMIQNLNKAGIAGKKGQQHSRELNNNEEKPQMLSLETTRTLSDQLTKLTQCGFDTAVGCHMMDAYDHGVISMEDRRRAARCEMLDELEEFVLLMKHYCLVVGVRSDSKSSVGFRLCSVGNDSLIGFQEARCTVVER